MLLVKLFGNGLHAVGQNDGWLTSCSADHYSATRHWARAIRTWSPQAKGFAWKCRHDNELTAYVLFGDRVTIDDITRTKTRVLTSASGEVLLRKVLERYKAELAAE